MQVELPWKGTDPRRFLGRDPLVRMTVADFIAMLHEGKIVEQGDAQAFRNSRHPFVRKFLERRGD